MPIASHRIDDRLVHGQVVVGWGQPLDVAFLAVVDDALAGSPWEQELYRLAAPPELEMRFVTVDDAAAQYGAWAADARVGIVLTADVETMARLASRVAAIRRVTVGGLHAGPGRAERLRYVFLDAADAARLEALAARGVDVVAQDLPAARPMPLAEWGRVPA
ncbi:MAG: PTS sugar transporter subunit IIB [Gemmatimonadota bacterium]|jgi:mannose/fructose/N-acetylgalactosamine-specific phosphotransferase system component IIB|nr:PTS sugar transporter subunit IIB [Gemmatimonadota bacterium]